MNNISFRKRLIAFIIRLFWMIVGIILSQLQLLTPWLLRNEIARHTNPLATQHSFFVFKNFFTLFLTSAAKVLQKTGQDSSMRTIFITMPLFTMLFFLRFKTIKKNLPWLILLAITIAMITGSKIYYLSATIFPPLAYSRFPCADYRAYLAIIFILFSVKALYGFTRHTFTRRNFILRSVILFLFMVWGIYEIYPGINHLTIKLTTTTLFIVLAYASLYILRKPEKNRALFFFTLFVVINGTAMWIFNHELWAHRIIKRTTLSKALVGSIKGRTHRPARQNIGGRHFNFTGYLTGIYVLGDYNAGMQLLRQQKVISNPALIKFMMQPSSYLIFPQNPGINIGNIENAIKQKKTHLSSSKEIQIKHYSNKELIYQINLQNPLIMIENEMYFPGWHGKIYKHGKEIKKIDAFAAGKLLRAWRLPAGHYLLKTSFTTPYLALGILISLLGLIIWIIGLLIVVRRS